jgi:hypothetical protein
MENTIIKGKESCGLCGCNLDIKTACLSCHCALKDFQGEALWDKVLTKMEEDLLKLKLNESSNT